jgi:Holliday junction resolvase RuvA-like protein
LLLTKLEKERLGKVKAPRGPTKPSAGSGSGVHRARAIPAGVRRAVFERDREQCTFVGEGGERCPQRGHLELDHVEARALGGTNAPSNLRVRCRAHNRLAAEDVFGKAHVAERIDFRQRKSRAPVTLPPPPQVIELVLRGLHNLGFSKPEARRALDQVSQHGVANRDELDAQDLLRGAIAALT